MEKFTVTIDLTLEQIRASYKHHFGQKKNPTKKEIASWIGNLAEADIESELSHVNSDDEETD